MSRDPGGGLELELEQLTSLFEMYGNAIEELIRFGDPSLKPLLAELVALRGAMVGALTQMGPSLRN